MSKPLLSNISQERLAYRLVLAFALMSVIPLLLTVYLVVVVWLPDLTKWNQITVILLLDLAVSILGFFLARSVVRMILRTSIQAKEIAEGRLSGRIEVDGNGSEIGEFAESFNEITAQLEKKIKELTESEEKFRHILDNVPDLLYYLDPEGKIISVNEEVTELLDYTKDEFQDRSFSDVVHEEDYVKFERTLRERRQDESRLTRGLRIRFLAKDGEFKTFEVNSRGIYDDANNFVGTEGLARDITAQVALEGEREEFLYMLTHDIKNPISAILFIIYMMRDGTIYENKYPEYYEKIENACNGVIRLVEDFLDFKKFELGTVEIQTENTDLCRMLWEISETYRSEATAKGKSLTIHGEEQYKVLEEQRLVAQVDCNYFPRVIENLISNAIKFAVSEIDMRITETEDEAIISVIDDGPGVSEEENEKIFKLFHTSPGFRTSKGIGVGLASAQKIVQAHGGRLWHETDPNGGCSFLVSLPKFPVPVDQDDKPIDEAIPTEPAPTA